MIEILEIQQVDEAVLTSVNRLLPQLSKSARPIDGDAVKKIGQNLNAPGFFLQKREPMCLAC